MNPKSLSKCDQNLLQETKAPEMWTAKQKIVLIIDMSCDKCKTNAKRIMGGTRGSITENIIIRSDSATLIASLRKRINKDVHVLSIEEMKPVNDKGPKNGIGEGSRENVQVVPVIPYYGYNYGMYPPPRPC